MIPFSYLECAVQVMLPVLKASLVGRTRIRIKRGHERRNRHKHAEQLRRFEVNGDSGENVLQLGDSSSRRDGDDA